MCKYATALDAYRGDDNLETSVYWCYYSRNTDLELLIL